MLIFTCDICKKRIKDRNQAVHVEQGFYHTLGENPGLQAGDEAKPGAKRRVGETPRRTDAAEWPRGGVSEDTTAVKPWSFIKDFHFAMLVPSRYMSFSKKAV